MTKEEFVAKSRAVHGDANDYSESEYRNNHTEVKIRCIKHNHVYFKRPSDHFKGSGCPLCWNERRKTGCHGVGIMDMDNESNTKCGILWRNMIARCCSKNAIKRNPSYRDCTVCNEWLTFSNFKKWFDENYIDGYELDKDILVKGNKVYSPDTCCLIPHFINSIFTKTNAKRGILPIGVSAMGIRYQARLLRYDKHIHIGTYDTPEEAFNAYKTAKEAYIKEVAQEYYDRGEITKKVYDALMRYKVEITD